MAVQRPRSRSIKGVFRNRRDAYRYAPVDQFIPTAQFPGDFYVDYFERNTTPTFNFGTAPAGGAYTAYTTTTGIALMVNNSAGRITAASTPKTFHQSLDGVGARTDCGITALVSFSAIPTGANCELSAYLRSNTGADSYYAVDLVLELAGTLSLSIEMNTTGARTDIASPINIGSYTANDKWWIELIVSGTNLEARAWPNGTARPSTPSLTGSDSSYASGVVGLRGRYASGNVNIPEIAFWDAHAYPATLSGVVLTDTGTPATLLTASATETREFGDTGIAAQTLFPSVTEGREFPAETGIAAQLLTHSGTETRESLDATSVPFCDLTVTYTEARESLDANTSTQLLTVTYTELREFLDANISTQLLTPSVTEQVLREFIDTGISAQLLTHSGTDTRESLDATSKPSQLLSPAQTTELREFTDTTSVGFVDLTPSVTELKEIVDTVIVAQLLTATAAELREAIDTLIVAQLLTVTSSLAQVWADTNTSTQLLAPTTVEARESIDTNTLNQLLSHTGVDLYTTIGETATCLSVLTHSGTDTLLHAYPDTNTTTITLTTSATDLFAAVDQDTVTQVLTASGPEVRESTDSNTSNLQLTYSTAEQFIAFDGVIPSFTRLTHSAIELATTALVDTSTVLFKATPSVTDFVVTPGDTATLPLKLSVATTVEFVADFIVNDYFIRGTAPLVPSTTLFPTASASSNWITAMLETGNLTGVMLGMGPSVQAADHVAIAETFVGNARDFFWTDTLGAGNAAFNPTGKNQAGTQVESVVPWQTDVLDLMAATFGNAPKHRLEIVPNVLGIRAGDLTYPTGGQAPWVNWTYGDNSYIDQCVTAWGNLMLTVPQQTMFRFWHEHGNADAYGTPNMTAPEFVYRWQKVFTRWGEMGCFTTNVLTSKCLIAWCPAASASSPGDDFATFPGTDYVHVIGRDIYCHAVDVDHPAGTFDATHNLKAAGQQWYDSYNPNYGPKNPLHRPLVVFESGVEIIDTERNVKTQQMYNRLSGAYTDNGQPPIISGEPNPAHDGPWQDISAWLWWDGGGNDLNTTPAGFQAAFTTATNQANLLPNGYTSTGAGTLFPGGYVSSQTPLTPTFGISKDNSGFDGPTWYAPYGTQNIYSVDLDNPGGKIESIPQSNTTGNHIPVGQQDQDVYAKFKLSNLPVAGNFSVELVARAVNIDNSYRAALVVKPTGAVDLILKRFVVGANLNLATNTNYIPSLSLSSYYEVEIVVTDRIIQYRAWKTGDATPAFVTYTDASATPVLGAGDAGIRLLGAAGAGTMASVLFDRFYVKSRVPVDIGDTGTATVKLDASQSSDLQTRGDDTATIQTTLTASGTTLAISVDTSTPNVLLDITQTTEVPAYADSTTLQLNLVPTVFEEVAGLDLDTGIALHKFTPSASFLATYGDTVSVSFARLTHSGLDQHFYVELNTVELLIVVPSAVVQFVAADTDTAQILLRPSAQFIQSILDHLLEGTMSRHWLADLEQLRYTAVIEPVRWSATEVRRWQFIFRGRGKLQ